ncbi:MAG TPA: hypothetical protein VM661_17030 [Candidatus Sulfotelmatobacter sp.]|jgi:hypothetical protein|nr:hypothetical protein [Candidatus Sulfotelmatobacter sp.]
MSREPVYAALFDLLKNLKTAGTVKLCDRRVRFLEEMGASELPALFMAVSHQQTMALANMPPRRTLQAKLYLYAANPDRHRSAGVVLNGLLDAVEQVLQPPAGAETLTLGGLVRHAFIDGPIEVFEGAQGERAAAVLTVSMLLP